MVPSRPILRPAREPPLLSQIQQTVGQFPAHWRRLVSARLEAVEKRAEVLVQPLLVLRAGPAIDARRAVLACAAESLAQKLHVDVMSQAEKGAFRRFSCQLRYPLKSR